MWYKYLVIIFLFYLLAILQNSFFSQFNLAGSVPNLVFAFLFLLVFFSAGGWELIFYAIIAGFFCDVYSLGYFGISMIIFLVMAFAIKKIQEILKSSKGDYPFIYYLPIFLISLIIYDSLLGSARLSAGFFYGIIYSLIFSVIGFFVYGRFLSQTLNNRQLKLFQ